MNELTSPFVRRTAITLAVVVAAGIAAAAFILSFAALWDVATRVWPNRHLSWLGPAVVDSTILQATVSLLAVTNYGQRAARRYFWALLIGAALTSILGNVLHAVVPANQPLTHSVSAIIATIPPVFLLLSTHSLSLLIRRSPVDEQLPVRASTESLRSAPSTDHSDVASAGGGAESTIAVDGSVTNADWLERARFLREHNGFDTPAPQIAAILHHHARNPSASTRDLGNAGDVHHNTARKIVNAHVQSGELLDA